MKLLGKKRFPDLSPGASEIVGVSANKFLTRKTGVTIDTGVAVVWSSVPTGLTFTSQTDTTTQSTVTLGVPTHPAKAYTVKVKFTFTDGTVRTVCVPLNIICD